MGRFIQYKLYLGRDIPNSNDPPGKVNDRQLARFIREFVSPRFDGFTVYTGMGCWKGTHEKVAILEIMVPMDDVVTVGTPPGDILAVAQAYKDQFNQESVMITTTPAIVRF